MNREELGKLPGLRQGDHHQKAGRIQELGYIELIGNKVIIVKDLEALESYRCNRIESHLAAGGVLLWLAPLMT